MVLFKRILAVGLSVIALFLCSPTRCMAQDNLFDADFQAIQARANQREVAAERELGSRLLDGIRGAAEDRAQGIHWLTKAADAGDGEACEILGLVYGAAPAGGVGSGSAGEEKVVVRTLKRLPNQRPADNF